MDFEHVIHKSSADVGLVALSPRRDMVQHWVWFVRWPQRTSYVMPIAQKLGHITKDLV